MQHPWPSSVLAADSCDGNSFSSTPSGQPSGPVFKACDSVPAAIQVFRSDLMRTPWAGCSGLQQLGNERRAAFSYSCWTSRFQRPRGSSLLQEVALTQEEQPTGGEAGLLSDLAVTGSCAQHGSRDTRFCPHPSIRHVLCRCIVPSAWCKPSGIICCTLNPPLLYFLPASSIDSKRHLFNGRLPEVQTETSRRPVQRLLPFLLSSLLPETAAQEVSVPPFTTIPLQTKIFPEVRLSLWHQKNPL